MRNRLAARLAISLFATTTNLLVTRSLILGTSLTSKCNTEKMLSFFDHSFSFYVGIKQVLTTGIFMLRCPYCDKQFLRKERCESHARIHTGERPFVCGHLLSSGQSTCTKAYREKRELVKHQTRNGHVTPSLKSLNPAPLIEVRKKVYDTAVYC